MNAPLEIPDAAIAAGIRAVDPEATAEEIANEIADGDVDARAVLAAAGPHIVAAELLRLADLITSPTGSTPMDALEEAYWDGLDEAAGRLRARAAELLDGGAK